MATYINMKSRYVFKHDTEANWLKATGFTPLEAEPIIYDKDSTHNYIRLKIGDGVTNVNNLPFLTEEEISALDLRLDALEEELDNKVDKVTGQGLSDQNYTLDEKNKLTGIAAGAQVNQNAFSNIKVGTTTVAADTETDTIEFIGNNITITPDATNDKITFAISNSTLGQGYGTCATAAATTAKVVSLSNYFLTTGGIVAVKFTYAVPASATMNINSKGAKAIYYKGSAITAGVINAGDTATFIYDGSQYHLLTVDRDNNTTYTLSSFGITATAAELNKLDGVTATATELNYLDGVTSNIQTQLNALSNAGSGLPSGGTEGQFLRLVGSTPTPTWVTIGDAEDTTF